MGRRVLAHISAAIVAGDKVDVLVVIILILRDPGKVLEFIQFPTETTPSDSLGRAIIPMPEQPGAKTDQVGTVLDCQQIVVGHAHRQKIHIDII